MNVLFISISSMQHMSNHSISQDLLREFKERGHRVYVICAIQRRDNTKTNISVEEGCTVLRVKIGNNKKANLLEKGITTLLLPQLYIAAIIKYFSDVTFDLVLYPTPPITHVKTVKFIKQRDGAQSYLLLKDIFPQNAVDLGMMSKNGFKGMLYKYFRNIEKKLYKVSDHIGCMSQANVNYLLNHNPEVEASKVEIFPNCIELVDVSITTEQRKQIREKYDIPQDKRVFVYGGNLGRPQGIPFVISCLKKLTDSKDAFFLIVGDGTEFNKLQAYIDEFKPKNVCLLKRLPKNDYDKMISACDVGLIFLDHRFTIPNFPSRLLAYLQARLPVLAATDPHTDIGEVIVSGGFGWWCESNDVDTFCALIDKAAAIDLEEMKDKGYQYLLDYYQVKNTYKIIVRSK